MEERTISTKPLGGKAYGSIPHLLGSKLGEGDHHIHEGQHRICTEKTRDKHDLIIVQEKYDGSNVCVAKIDGTILALTRRGYMADSSPFEQHHVFAKWVHKERHRFNDLLMDGDKVCGEWLLQAHGLEYEIRNEPFVVFDYFCEKERLKFGDLVQKVQEYDFSTPRPLFIGHASCDIEYALSIVCDTAMNWIKAIGIPEGLIYRVERNGKLDFIAKYVRADFITGAFLPEISGRPEVWNFDIEKLLS
jgi:hypothetical protein